MFLWTILPYKFVFKFFKILFNVKSGYLAVEKVIKKILCILVLFLQDLKNS